MILQNVFLLDDILNKPHYKIHIGSRMVFSDLRKNDYLRYVAWLKLMMLNGRKNLKNISISSIQNQPATMIFEIQTCE